MKPNRVDQATGDDGLYTAAERCIFPYGGGSDLAGDPLAIDRRYHDAVSLYDGDLAAQWMKDDRLALQFMALRKLWPALHASLGVAELDEATGEGHTAEETIAILRRFFAWKAAITAKYRDAAEWVAAYGHPPGARYPFERYAGLHFNLSRIQCIPAVAAWRGAVAASGSARVFFGLADAMAPNGKHAREIDELIEQNREQSRAWAENQQRQ